MPCIGLQCGGKNLWDHETVFQDPCVPSNDLDIKACIPLAMMELHNFICINHPDEIYDFNKVGLNLDPRGDVGVLAVGLPGLVECGEAQDRHTEVARLMWAQYKATIENRA